MRALTKRAGSAWKTPLSLNMYKSWLMQDYTGHFPCGPSRIYVDFFSVCIVRTHEFSARDTRHKSCVHQNALMSQKLSVWHAEETLVRSCETSALLHMQIAFSLFVLFNFSFHSFHRRFCLDWLNFLPIFGSTTYWNVCLQWPLSWTKPFLQWRNRRPVLMQRPTWFIFSSVLWLIGRQNYPDTKMKLIDVQKLTPALAGGKTAACCEMIVQHCPHAPDLITDF